MDEGYIKYKARWTKEQITVAPEIVREINLCRSKLFAKKWIGMYPDGIGYGNISLKLNDKSFLISGSATGAIARTTINDYAIVDDYDIKNNHISCRGMVAASSESLSHAALYTKETTHIVHIHSEKLWLDNRNKFPTTDESIAYGTPEMAAELLRCKESIESDFGVIVMGGHWEGIIAYGNSYEQIFELLLAL